MIASSAGPLLGLLVIGGVIALIIWGRSRKRAELFERECPYCKSRMRGDATTCPHCHRESTAWRFHEGRWWRQDEAGEWEYLEQTSDWTRWVKAAAREP